MPSEYSYKNQLLKIHRLLELGDKAVPHLVVEKLGNSVSAMFSVPTAIYCFLRAQQSIADIEVTFHFFFSLVTMNKINFSFINIFHYPFFDAGKFSKIHLY